MALTRTQMSSLISFYSGRSSTDGDDISTTINLLLQIAIDECIKIHKFKQTETRDTSLVTVADVATVTLPSDLAALGNVLISDPTISPVNAYPVPNKGKDFVDKFYPNRANDPSRRPEVCYEENGKIEFAPTPDIVYNVTANYWKFLGDTFDDDADECPLPDATHAIIAYVVGEIFDGEDEDTLSLKFKSKFIALLSSAVSFDMSKPGRVFEKQEHDIGHFVSGGILDIETLVFEGGQHRHG